ncbi:MAG: pyruvate kinase [Isosphaeraceae bacterium]|nr:pyruvate kinase [Isosphaeraceae bacterium]
MADVLAEPLGKVHTKIVATVGPASRDPAVLKALIEAGVDVFRLNFSHGTHEEHAETLQAIRAVADDCGRLIAVLQDLGGPKVRLGPIPGDQVECPRGALFRLVAERTSDDPHELTSTYRELARDLRPGATVLFADGVVAMRVEHVDERGAELRVTLAGRLRSRQGINVPDVPLSLQALTDKDKADLEWTAQHKVEYVGLSFVQRPGDLVELREELDRRGCRARIVAKIEKPQAVENLEEILAQTDAVMVARGDLGVEMDVAKVPAIQKRIISACHRARIPVITATQMLNSMETSNRPTRAEASDVFNAVLDGTDAVMLSGETAIGQYPVEAVATMSRIAAEAERLLLSGDVPSAVRSNKAGQAPFGGRGGWIQPITESVVEAASLVSRRLGAALMIVVTHSGRTALALSKQRSGTPTLALSDNAEIARAMALYWSVTPLHFPAATDSERALNFALDWACERNLVARGDRVVLVSGTMPNSPIHNGMLVREVDGAGAG